MKLFHFGSKKADSQSATRAADHSPKELGSVLSREEERQLDAFCSDPQVLIEITSRCNFTCDYCSSAFKDRKKVDMSVDLFAHIVKQLPGFTTHAIRLHIDGEPTLHPRFHEMVALVNQQGLRVGLATNGSLLDPKWLDLDMDLAITLSTSAEEFATRHKRMDFGKYIERAKTYVREWARGPSTQKLMLQLIHDHGGFTGDEAENAWNEFADDLIESAELSRHCNRLPDKPWIWLKPGGRSVVFIKYPIVAGGLYPDQGKRIEYVPVEKGFCDSAWKRLAVLADGRLSYCCIDLSGGTAYTEANAIWEQPLKELWLEHPRIRQVRASFQRGEVLDSICKTCLAGAPSAKRSVGFNG